MNILLLLILFFFFTNIIRSISGGYFKYPDYLIIFIALFMWGVFPAINFMFSIIDIGGNELYFDSYFYYALIFNFIVFLYRPAFKVVLIKTLDDMNKDDKFVYKVSLIFVIIINIIFFFVAPSNYEELNALAPTSFLNSTIFAYAKTLFEAVLFVVSLRYMSHKLYFNSHSFIILAITIIPFMFSGGRFGAIYFLVPLIIILLRDNNSVSKGKNKGYLKILFFVLLALSSIVVGAEIRMLGKIDISSVLDVISNTSGQFFELFIKHLAIKFDSVYYSVFYNPPDVNLLDLIQRMFFKLFFMNSGYSASPNGLIEFSPKFQIAEVLSMGQSGNVGACGICIDFLTYGNIGNILNIIMLVIFVNFYRYLWLKQTVISQAFAILLIGFPALFSINYSFFEMFAHAYNVLILYFISSLGMWILRNIKHE